MRLNDLKEAVNVTSGIKIQKIIFDPMQELNVDREHDYPLIMWDFNTLKFDTKKNRVPETIFTIRCFIFQFMDQYSKENTEVKEEKWQQMHTDFIEYLDKINEGTHEVDTQVNGEFYTEGTGSTESEIAIGYDLTIRQYCSG